MTQLNNVGSSTRIKLSQIDQNPWQPRQQYDADYIESLAHNIHAHASARPDTGGLLQIPMVRRAGDRYQLAFGHNRWKAFEYLSRTDDAYSSLPVTIAELTDEEMATMAWSENAARKDLTALEEAQAIDRYREDFGWTDVVIGEKLGLHRSTVTHKRRLLRLPEKVRGLLMTGEISERMAVLVLPLCDDAYDFGWDDTIDAYHLLQLLKNGNREIAKNYVTHVQRNMQRNLENAPFRDRAILDERVQQPYCRGCPRRIDDTCCNIDCFKLKMGVWERLQVEPVAHATGLPMAEGYTMGTFYQGHERDEQALAHAKETSCENLRVQYAAEGMKYIRVDESPLVAYGCQQNSWECACRRQFNTYTTDHSIPVTAQSPAAVTEQTDEERVQAIQKTAALSQRFIDMLKQLEPKAWATILGYHLDDGDMMGLETLDDLATYLVTTIDNGMVWQSLDQKLDMWKNLYSFADMELPEDEEHADAAI